MWWLNPILDSAVSVWWVSPAGQLNTTQLLYLLPLPSGMGQGIRRAERKFMGWDKNCIKNKKKTHNTINNNNNKTQVMLKQSLTTSRLMSSQCLSNFWINSHPNFITKHSRHGIETTLASLSPAQLWSPAWNTALSPSQPDTEKTLSQFVVICVISVAVLASLRIRKPINKVGFIFFQVFFFFLKITLLKSPCLKDLISIEILQIKALHL